VKAANLAAVIPTTELAAAAADEVSAAIAKLFGSHAQEFQTSAALAATWHEEFVRSLSAAAASYAGTEAAIAASIQRAVNAPAELLLGRDLIGTGAGGQTGTAGQALLGGGSGSGAKSILIDFVRHGQTASNASSLIDTNPPGPPINATGLGQAQTVAGVLAPKGPFAGIFESQLLRTQMTGGFLTSVPGMPAAQLLAGLNEISAGNWDGLPQITPQGLLYLVSPIAWTLGFPLFPMLAPGAHLNGITFNQGFNSALQTMYGTAMANPVLAADGNITDVAYSSAFTIGVGAMMNVSNPHPLFLLTQSLPNTGIVQVTGSPQDGWTLVSWNGNAVPSASLPTQLFVATRNLIEAPQYAIWDTWQALHTGNATTILNSIGDGIHEVNSAALHYPVAVVEDLVDAL
jgi:broad specificity phosphatase PhoE